MLYKRKVLKNANLQSMGLYEISSIKVRALDKEPGLLVAHSVLKMFGNRKFYIMLVNAT